MPLRCLDREGKDVQSFDLSEEYWHLLNAKAKRFAVMPLAPHQLKHDQLENQPASANH